MRRLSLIAFLVFALVRLDAGEVSRPCPDFTVALPDGSNIDLKKYRGKVVTLEVMLTTCPACQRCALVIQKLYDELGPGGYQPLAVAINEGAARDVPPYVRALKIHYPVGTAESLKAREFLQHPPYKTMYVPQLVFIDRKGIIRAQYTGTDDFFRNEESNVRAMVKKLLGEKVAP